MIETEQVGKYVVAGLFLFLTELAAYSKGLILPIGSNDRGGFLCH
jgi:hypothetical protein